MFTHFPSAAETVLVRAMISAFWAKLPGDRAFSLIIPSSVTTAYPGASLVAQLVKNKLAMQEITVRSLVGKIPWRRT